MKKIAKKFISLILALSLTTVIVNAEAGGSEVEIPSFNNASCKDLTDQLGFIQGGGCFNYQYSAETGAKFWNDAYMEGKYVQLVDISSDNMAEKTKYYASGNIKYLASVNDSYAQYYFPAVTTAYVTRTSTAGTLEHGYISVVFKGNNEPASLGFWPIDRADGQQNIIYNIKSFPDIKTSIGDSHGFVYSVDNATNKLNIWIDGTKVLSDFCLSTETDEYGGTFSDYEYKVGVSTAYAKIIQSDYRVWLEKSILEELPEFDESNQIKILNKTDLNWNSNTTPEFEKLENYASDSNAIYTSFSIAPDTSWNDWSSIYVLLAETDYKSTEGTWYLGLRLIGAHGYAISLINNTTQEAYIKADCKYPDSSYNLPTTGLKIKTCVANNKISIWMNDEPILENYSNTEYNIKKASLGHHSMLGGRTYYSTDSVMSWVNNDNYQKLGDVNGDSIIDIKDMIRIKKYCSDSSNVKIFKKCIESEDIVLNSSHIVKLKKILLGIAV